MSSERTVGSARTVVLPLVFGAWLVGVDAWVKIVARLGACPGADAGVWSTPGACTEVTLTGGVVLLPGVRAGLPGLVIDDPLSRQLAALAVIAVVTIATIVIGRARTAQPADMLALACMGAGALVWGAPILAGPGVAFTELVAGGLAFGIGDLAMAIGALWLVFERARA